MSDEDKVGFEYYRTALQMTGAQLAQAIGLTPDVMYTWRKTATGHTTITGMILAYLGASADEVAQVTEGRNREWQLFKRLQQRRGG